MSDDLKAIDTLLKIKVVELKCRNRIRDNYEAVTGERTSVDKIVKLYDDKEGIFKGVK